MSQHHPQLDLAVPPQLAGASHAPIQPSPSAHHNRMHAEETGAADDPASVYGAVPPAARPRGFAGFSPRELVVMGLFAVLLLWAAWATRELMVLKDRRTVSVSLATLVQDFVSSEARRGATQQEAAARTKAYLGAVDAAMRAISEDGTTILVSEAVLGNSLPDVTDTVMKAVNARLGLMAAPAGQSDTAAPDSALPPPAPYPDGDLAMPPAAPPSEPGLPAAAGVDPFQAAPQ